MMKTTIGTSLAALIAFAGMEEVSAVSIRQEDSALGEYLKPEAGGLAQTNIAQASDIRSTAWNQPVTVTFENTSNEAVTLHWIDYYGNPVSYGQIGAGQTKLMYTYATHPWKATADSSLFTTGGEAIFVPEASDNGQTIKIAPWTEHTGMCTDANNDHYDHWETFGVSAGWGKGGVMSLEQCGSDCMNTPHCVGVNYSKGSGRCALRMEDGFKVTLPDYETPQDGYKGVGAVAGAAPQGDYMCYVNPSFGSSYDCDHSVNFITGGPAYSQISLTDGCSGNVCDANPKYGAPNNNDKAIEYCQDECNSRAQCEGFFF